MTPSLVTREFALDPAGGLQARVKAKFLGYTFLVANVTTMSLTCHEAIGRVGRVTRMLRGCYTRKLLPWNLGILEP